MFLGKIKIVRIMHLEKLYYNPVTWSWNIKTRVSFDHHKERLIGFPTLYNHDDWEIVIRALHFTTEDWRTNYVIVLTSILHSVSLQDSAVVKFGINLLIAKHVIFLKNSRADRFLNSIYLHYYRKSLVNWVIRVRLMTWITFFLNVTTGI